MNEKQVLSKLISDNVAGGRVYRFKAPDGTDYPYIRFTVAQSPLAQDLISNDSFTNTFEFQIYGQTFSQAKSAQLELRYSLKLVAREIHYTEDEYPDPDTGNIRILNGWYLHETN